MCLYVSVWETKELLECIDVYLRGRMCLYVSVCLLVDEEAVKVSAVWRSVCAVFLKGEICLYVSVYLHVGQTTICENQCCLAVCIGSNLSLRVCIVKIR